MFNRIVVGVDGSGSSRSALRWAADQARKHGAPLVAVMAWHYPAVAYVPLFATGVAPAEAMQAAAEAGLANLVAEELGDAADVNIEQIAVWSSRRGALLDQLRPGTLLVIGRHELVELGQFIVGEFGDGIIRDATCPVAIVPSGASH